MAYGIHDLELTGLQVKTILSVHISHKPGEHGVMELTADMGEKNMDIPIQETGSGQAVVLSGKRNGKKTPLFCGVITKLTAQSMGKSCHVNLSARSWSYQMDIKKKSRSFQDTSMTYGSLVSQIVGEYPGAECQNLFADVPLGEIAVQYQETDWQFLKRMLSALHVPFVCSEVREKICMYAGAAQIPRQMDVESIENTWKDMDELAYWKEIGEEVTDADSIRYQIKLDNSVSLYSDITFRNRQLAAGEIEYRTIGSTVYEFVTLQSRQGILQKPIYPMQLVGTAFEGTVKEVQGENMKIHLRIDDDYSGDDCYWFPFSTPSASSDGSGWYCMPEVGDQVRVYFPSKKTGDVIAISAVSDYQPTEDIPKNWDMGDNAAVSKKLGTKNMTAAKMPVMKLAAVAKEPLLKGMETARMPSVNTVAITKSPLMKRMDISKFTEMNTLSVPKALGVKTMDVSKASGVKTMDVSKAPAMRAVSKAVSFAQTGTIRPAATVFGEQGIRKDTTVSTGAKTMAMPAAAMTDKGVMKR